MHRHNMEYGPILRDIINIDDTFRSRCATRAQTCYLSPGLFDNWTDAERRDETGDGTTVIDIMVPDGIDQARSIEVTVERVSWVDENYGVVKDSEGRMEPFFVGGETDADLGRADIQVRAGEHQELTDVSGVGLMKANDLRDAGFESVESLRDAEQRELAEADVISDALAARIKADVSTD